MVKRPFVTFIVVVGTLILGVLWFIQSSQFARALKSLASRLVPTDIGIVADFSELSVKLFPPGFSIQNPKITLGKRNIVDLPEGSSVEAKRIDFTFLPFQVLSGNVRVHEVTIVDGAVQLNLDYSESARKSKHSSTHFDIHWDDLLQIKADAIALERVKIKLGVKNSPLVKDSELAVLEGKAEKLRLEHWSGGGSGSKGYEVHLDLTQIHGGFLKALQVPEALDEIRGEAHINAMGLQLDSLEIKNGETGISFTGDLKGDLLKPKDLIADMSVRLNGRISEFIKFYVPQWSKLKQLPEGLLTFSGKVQGDLQKALQTVRADGTATVSALSYQQWKADQVQVEAKWEASPTGGEISLRKAVISAAETPRVGGGQPGGGGRIEIGPVNWVVGSLVSTPIPVNFQGAHIHWLGAPALKDIYPLDFRLNGSVDALFVPPKKSKPWELRANLNTWVSKFQLDNQHYLKDIPLSVVFKVPRVDVKGSVIVNSTGVYFTGTDVILPQSQFLVNGKIDFKTGLDFVANGPIHLEDLNEIAENKIRGDGSIRVYVHGPVSNVLVECGVDLKEASYLSLLFGDMKGKIIWDDDPQNLIFSNITAVKGVTSYSGGGVVAIGKKKKIDLDVQIGKGDIQNLLQIFNHLTESLSWFPRTLTGPFMGNIMISGGLGLSELKVKGELKGTNWEYEGERFKNVYLQGGYVRGKYLIDEFRSTKNEASLSGDLAFDTDGTLNWEFRTQNLILNDIDLLTQLDVPLRGKLDIQSSGLGKFGTISSSTVVDLDNFSIRGQPMPPSRLVLETSEGADHYQASILGNQSNFNILYDSNSRQNSFARIEFKKFDFTPLLLLLNPKSIQDKSLAGYLSGTVNLTFRSSHFERSSGNISISDYMLARADTKFYLGNPLSFKINEGSFDINGLALKGKSSELFLNLKSRAAELKGSITGDVDTSMLEFLTPVIVRASGTTDLDLAIGGNILAPTLSGMGNLQGNTIHISALDAPIENIHGAFRLDHSVLSVKNVQGDVGGGRVTAQGDVTLFADRYPTLDLSGKLLGPKLKIYPFQFIKVNGDIGIHGSTLPYIVDGNVVVDSALSKEKILNHKQTAQGLKVIEYTPPPTRQRENNDSKFKLNIDVEASRGVLVQNDLFRDLQAKFKVKVVNTFEAPRILGKAEVLQGKVIFKDHAFQIQTGKASFDSPRVFDPSFELNASTEVSGYKVQLFVNGRVDKNKIEFVSSPSLPETEILSLLTMGMTSIEAKKLNASDLNAVQQGEAASLVLHALDFNRDLEDKTGFQLKVDESVDQRQGVSAFRPQADANAAAAPQITLRRKLGKKFVVSGSSTVGLGTNKAYQVNLDYLVSPDVSLSGVYINYGNTGTDSSTLQNSSSTIQNSYGLDLKFQKRFK